MEKEIITNELVCDLPEGFRLFTEEELDNFFVEKKGIGFAIKNPEKHGIIAIYALKMNFIVKHFADDRSMMNGSKYKIEASLEDNDYEFKGDFTEERFGKTLYGFKYAYVVDGIPHEAEYLLLKGIKYYYGIQYYSWTEFDKENSVAYEFFKDSLELGL